MDVNTTDGLLAELLAHSMVLQARVDALTRVLARRQVALPDVLEGANHVADRTFEVLRVARQLANEEPDPASLGQARSPNRTSS